MSGEAHPDRQHMAPGGEVGAPPWMPVSPGPAPEPVTQPVTPSAWGPPGDTERQPPPEWPPEPQAEPQSSPPAPPPGSWPLSYPQQAPAQEPGDVYWPTVAPPPSPAPEALLADPYAAGVGTRPSRRPGLVTGLLIGIVLALAAGVGGFFVGTGVGTRPAPQAHPSPSPSLHLYEANQAGLNKTKLGGEFAPLAQPMLPWMGGCTADTDPGGIKLPADESSHVFCRYSGTTVHFSLYRSASALESEREYREHLASSTGDLVPGVVAPGRKKGGVSGQPGDYVEFAWKADDGRAWCGIWWDRDDVPLVGLRLEALCQEGLGGSWEPLRDLWQRYS